MPALLPAVAAVAVRVRAVAAGLRARTVPAPGLGADRLPASLPLLLVVVARGEMVMLRRLVNLKNLKARKCQKI